MEKCSNKIDACQNKPKCNENKYIYCDLEKHNDKCGYKMQNIKQNCGCKPVEAKKTCKTQCKQQYVNPCYEKDEIIYVEDTKININKGCSTYVTPMYDMYQMQCMGEFSQQYPSLEMPYMNPYMNSYDDMSDMWMNYYMMMQNMTMQPRDTDY